METLSATEARAHLFELLRGSTRKNRQYRIAYKNEGVVLLSEEEYESLLETLYLLSSPGFRRAFQKARREIRAGKTTPFEKVFPRE